MKAILLGNGSRRGVPETVARFRPELARLLTIVGEDFEGRADMSEIGADLAIVFGGDGSILRAIHQLAARQIPLLAVNVGTLAFLSGITPDELIPFLKRNHPSGFSVRRQLLLECSLWRKKSELTPEEAALYTDDGGKDRDEVRLAKKMVVNEVAVLGGPPFEILHIELAVDGQTVAAYRGDGLILSTPTGSTAHNLSAGGPILRRDLNAVVIAPVNPHSLSYRPVVDSADRVYELSVLNRPVHVVVDGDDGLVMRPGDRVVVERAPVCAKMIRIPGKNYYKTLREKLGWSAGGIES